MDSGVTILVPAAGASRRMGGADKLVERIGGTPLLRRQLARACAAVADSTDRVVVTLPAPERSAQARRRHAALDGLPLRRVIVQDPGEGMAASLRAGLAAVPQEASGVLILLPDMPDIETADLCRLMEAFARDPQAPILRACTADGRQGHPVLFPRRHFAQLAQIEGDQGARAVLQRHARELRCVPLPGMRALTDLDTPEAWQAWRDAGQDAK